MKPVKAISGQVNPASLEGGATNRNDVKSMPCAIRPKPGILKIDPYIGGDSVLAGDGPVYKLSSNENPLGPSPKAVAAFQATAGSLERYPPSDHGALRAAIAGVHGADPDRIICGDGSDEVIAWLCHAYAGPGDEVLYTEHGFLMYRISALASGAAPVIAPETGRRVDVDRLLAATTPRTRLVFLTNPGNPTATMIGDDEIRRLAEGLPPEALLVLDGAYAEFADDYDGGQALVQARDNVMMTRTFSKIYGLGGLRVGWGYGPHEVVGMLNRIRGPFNVTAPSLAAAQAAVTDRDYLAHCRAENARWREFLIRELAGVGIMADPSSTNFILARFGDITRAEAADRALRARRVLVRRVAGYGLPDCLRITVGDETACRLVVDVLRDFMRGQD